MNDKSEKLPEIRFLAIDKPSVTDAEAGRMLAEHFGVSGELYPLASERDLNYRVTPAGGSRSLLKISNHDEPRAIVELEIAALAYVAATDPALPVPRIVPTRDGAPLAELTSRDGRKHLVRLLTYLPGTVVAESPRSVALALDIGATAARMALALQGFVHPAACGRRLLWDVRELGALRPVTADIVDAGARVLIDGIARHFVDNVIPRLAGLRAQVAHMDLNDHNLLVDPRTPDTVCGILDFGDLHHGPLLQDAAIALANVMHPDDEPLAKARAFLRGYQQVLPLQPDETGLLYDVLLAWFTLYFLILTRRGDSYDTGDPVSVLALIRRLNELGRERFTDLVRQACGH